MYISWQVVISNSLLEHSEHGIYAVSTHGSRTERIKLGGGVRMRVGEAEGVRVGEGEGEGEGKTDYRDDAHTQPHTLCHPHSHPHPHPHPHHPPSHPQGPNLYSSFNKSKFYNAPIVEF